MLLVAAILTVLVTSFFCSLSEAALLSIGRARCESLAAKSASGRLLKKMKEKPERPIAAILIVNTVANTGGAALAGAEYRRMFGDGNMAMFGVGLTIAVLLFSEFIPKSIGVRYAEKSALIVAAPLQLAVQLLRPATWLVSKVAGMMGMGGDRSTNVSIDDIRAMARLAAASKLLGREEVMIIEAASRMPRVPVRQLMIHKDDIVYFSLEQDAETNLVRARRSLHSRLLICRSDLSTIMGVVNMKEVLWRLADEPGEVESELLNRILGESMREPLSVSSDIDVSDLIHEFSTKHEHLAVVRGEDGDVVGMITLEDVIEELMGEIDDEFDRSPTGLDAIGPHRWRAGGGALWADVEKTVGLVADDDLEADLDGRLDVNDVVADYVRGQAFNNLEPVLRDLPPHAIARTALDPQLMAIAALDVVDVLEKPDVRARFDLLHEDLFDTKHLENLEEIALAALYVRNQLLSERVANNDAKLSAVLVHDATERKDRMMRVAEYHLGDMPAVQAELASIRVGSGYVDLASDLTRLATLFEQHAELLAGDKRWYRSEDAAAANAVALDIYRELGPKADEQWEDLGARSVSLLRRTYDEIRVAAEFIFRDEPTKDGFPSLFTGARRARRAASQEVAADASEVAPAADSTPDE